MEEQRQRQEQESRQTSTAIQETSTTPGQVADREEAMLQQALSMAGTPEVSDSPMPVATPNVDFGSMSEEEQIAYAMQLSLQNVQDADDGDSSRPDTQQSGASAMETDSQVHIKGV